MARYTYESPGTNFAILRDTRMDGILNSGLNNAIKAKINVDVLGGTKYVERKSYSFSTNRSVQRAYSRATLTKYTFDVYKKCLIGGKTLVLGATWFVAPSASHAYYVELR
ncbi:MAG: hypothetical protein DYG89_00825 [Caldilinea sp. CFX5]|nr:hypothetical protein [Caldilinea sp. CFX5]